MWGIREFETEWLSGRRIGWLAQRKLDLLVVFERGHNILVPSASWISPAVIVRSIWVVDFEVNVGL